MSLRSGAEPLTLANAGSLAADPTMDRNSEASRPPLAFLAATKVSMMARKAPSVPGYAA